MIKFGTSGWRAIIADEFTFDAVRRVTTAISAWIVERAPGSQVIVGYDTRFMAEDFAAEGARVLAANQHLLGPDDDCWLVHNISRGLSVAGAAAADCSQRSINACVRGTTCSARQASRCWRQRSIPR